jgi:hypothetical protein
MKLEGAGECMSKGAEMSTTLTSLAEYLSTTYHPDRDYVDGQLEERNDGEFEHAAIQAFLTGKWACVMYG